MALMFQRIARNYAKNGYYPTDADTLERVLSALTLSDDAIGRDLRLLDPCCGEGSALAEVHSYLSQQNSETTCHSYGIEFDEDRAYTAKTLLGRVVHADLMDVVIQPRSFSLLFLNSPYGDLVADQAGGSAVKWKGRKRLEKLFYQRTVNTLQEGGVMVLVVPNYSIDSEFAAWIVRHFTRIQVHSAATEQFKQVVLFGVRQRYASSPDNRVRKILEGVGTGDTPISPLPLRWDEQPYEVPATPIGEPRFHTTAIDARQLANEIGVHRDALWPRFAMTFGAGARAHRRPLRKMSRWHLALALAAGQVAGKVESRDGRVYLVKGDTVKATRRSSDVLTNADGSVTETTTDTDHFVPAIRAFDLTPGSDTFGEVLTIR